jgi:glutathione S-transferase
MEYVSCAEARPMKGLRVVLSVGSPGPWCEAAKSILHARKVSYVAVGRVGMEHNEELFAWTGQPNAPVAMYEDEKPRHTWLDILYLAERLGSGPSLLPDSREMQIECIGLSHQILGEDGLGWNRRLNMFDMMLKAAGGDPSKVPVPPRLFKDYTITPETTVASTGRMIDILNLLGDRLQRQKAAGSNYLVGDRLTATDIHFATMFGMVDPLPHAVNPMPDFLRGLYESGEPHVRAAVTPELQQHRDFIYRTHLKLPMDF